MTQTQKSFWIITDEANNETNYLTFDSFKNAILKIIQQTGLTI